MAETEKTIRNTTVYCDSEVCVYRDEAGICCRPAISLDDSGRCEDGE